jgi:hypothetical protein
VQKYGESLKKDLSHTTFEGKIFLSLVLLRPMIYRSREELPDVIIQSGFLHENVRLVYEPFEIHGMAVCRKRPGRGVRAGATPASRSS